MAKVWSPPTPGIHKHIWTIPIQKRESWSGLEQQARYRELPELFGGDYRIGQESRKILEERRLGWGEGTSKENLGMFGHLYWCVVPISESEVIVSGTWPLGRAKEVQRFWSRIIPRQMVGWQHLPLLWRKQTSESKKAVE